MARDYTGGGDPRRSIELLWRRHEPGRRGPKQRLSTEAVVATAIALADAEGLGALSMRRVAEAAGVSPMSLYTYVPSKAELLDLMFDQVLGEAADPDETVQGWRARLTFVARQRWLLAERHPWLLDLAMHRPPLGPNVLRKIETLIQALDGHGLSYTQIEYVAETLQYYMIGALQSAREAREVERASGLTDDQWIAMVEPALEALFDDTEFPALRRMGRAKTAGEAAFISDPIGRFEFGLARVLDGIEALIRSTANPLGERAPNL